MKKLAICFLLCAIPTVSLATPSWTPFAKGSDGKFDYYDAESLIKSGITVNVWTKSDVSKDQVKHIYSAFKAKKLPNAEGVKKAKYVLMNYKLDCSARSIKALKTVLHDSKGNVVFSDGEEPSTTTTVPGTSNDALRQVVCQ